MKTNHDGTTTLMPENVWSSCASCGQRVTGDSIHTCSPQLKELWEIAQPYSDLAWQDCTLDFARAILRKAQEK
jgi:transposase-like protein